MKKNKILFICKIRNDFYGPSFGLINSCKFISNALKKYDNIESKVVTVIDNNGIDKEVFNYKPTHVFIEALWVVPSKFEELMNLHPNIKWYVRIHSKIPFLANEGIGIEWLRNYDTLSSFKKYNEKFHIAANSKEIINSFKICYDITILYFPNIYSPITTSEYVAVDSTEEKTIIKNKNYLDIACFGAIRPMKNQLNQALAAIAFGNENDLNINFHINYDRCETGGDPVLKNLIYAFKNTRHKLINHPWLDHQDFIKVVKQMDIGLQVSISETFNIVAADFAWNNIPIIGSDEIVWLDKRYKADVNDINDIIDKLHFAYKNIKYNTQRINLKNLENYNNKSIKIWLSSL